MALPGHRSAGTNLIGFTWLYVGPGVLDAGPYASMIALGPLAFPKARILLFLKNHSAT